jgi:hypothetical protein
MADKKESASQAGAPAAPAPSTTGQGQQQQQIAVRFDRAKVGFSNFTLVTGTPEEVIVDFGVNTNAQQVNVDARIGMTYATARRLAAALTETIKRFEQAVQQARARQGGPTT